MVPAAQRCLFWQSEQTYLWDNTLFCTIIWIPWLITESWFRWLFVHIFLNIRAKLEATDSTFIDTDTSTGISVWDLSFNAKLNVKKKGYFWKWLQSIHCSVTKNHTGPMSFPSKNIALYYFNSLRHDTDSPRLMRVVEEFLPTLPFHLHLLEVSLSSVIYANKNTHYPVNEAQQLLSIPSIYWASD